MTEETNAPVPWNTQHSLLTLVDLATEAGLPAELAEKFVDEGLIEPSGNGNFRGLLPSSAVERLKRIMRLRCDLGVNLEGIAVILDMRERIENLQAKLERLLRWSDLEADQIGDFNAGD